MKDRLIWKEWVFNPNRKWYQFWKPLQIQKRYKVLVKKGQVFRGGALGDKNSNLRKPTDKKECKSFIKFKKPISKKEFDKTIREALSEPTQTDKTTWEERLDEHTYDTPSGIKTTKNKIVSKEGNFIGWDNDKVLTKKMLVHFIAELLKEEREEAFQIGLKAIEEEQPKKVYVVDKGFVEKIEAQALDVYRGKLIKKVGFAFDDQLLPIGFLNKSLLKFKDEVLTLIKEERV